MLICCQLNVNDLAEKLAKKNFMTMKNNDFMYKLYKCISNNVTSSPDYQRCNQDELARFKRIISSSDPKLLCCNRLVSYFCMKKL